MDLMNFSHYGEERERIATEDELAIFNNLLKMSGRDLKLVRKSDNYVTALLGQYDVARFKYSPRAKWIMFPCVAKAPKNYITTADDVLAFSDLLQQCIAQAESHIAEE